jgi:hypothetical protein
MSATLPEIKCQAKDKTTCKYHGAILRAETALAAKDWSAWAAAQADIAKAAAETPEVLAFFAAQAPAEPAKVLAPKLAMGMWDKARKEIHLDGLVSKAKLKQYLMERVGLNEASAVQELDQAVDWVSKLTPQDTVYTGFAKEKPGASPGQLAQLVKRTPIQTEMRRRVIALWQDTDYLQRLDVRDQPTGVEFQGRLNQRLALLLGEHGEVMKDSDSGWGWQNDAYTRYRDGLSYQQFFTVKSVLNVQEDEWDQNDGTGVWSSHEGFQGQCLLDDNTVRILRYEGDLATIVRMLESQR